MANSIKGKIVSLSSLKTVVVEVERYFTHPLYKKRVKRTKKYKAHYEGKELKLGEMVELISVRPISKEKHFKIKI